MRYYENVHIITRKRLIEFSKKHPDAENPLNHCHTIIRKTDYTSFADLKITFPTADPVGKFTVFNIGGNKYRLIVAIHYNRKKVYIRHVLTHAEYDRGKWRRRVMPAKLIKEAGAEYRRIRQRVPLGVLRTEAEYKKAVAVLDEILDEIGQKEDHPLADMAEALALFIQSYEDTHVGIIPEMTGPEVMKALMEVHGLSQSDMPEIGSQGVVSEILSGKRELNVRQISRLAKRFGVSPAVFIPAPTHKKS